MGNRPAERRLRGFVGVEVDELMVVCRVGEYPDPGLVDCQPGRNANFGSGAGADLIEAGDRHEVLLSLIHI